MLIIAGIVNIQAKVLFEYENDRVTLDEKTGDIILTYDNLKYSSTPIVLRVVPPTKFTAFVESKIDKKNNNFIYKYSINSNIASKQNISAIYLEAKQVFENTMIQPKNWQYLASGEDASLPIDENLGWMPNSNDKGIKPGDHEKHFSFMSKALPSIGKMRLDGDTDVIGYPYNGPSQRKVSPLRLTSDIPGRSL